MTYPCRGCNGVKSALCADCEAAERERAIASGSQLPEGACMSAAALEPSTDLAVPEGPMSHPLSLLSALETSGHATDVSLDLTDPDMTFDRWEALGRVLGEVERRSRWYLGDWINFGEAVFGDQAFNATEGVNADRYNVAMRVTGLAYGTLQNYASTCRRVAKARRRFELPFAVHEAVATLEPEEQTKWLQKAVDDGWGRDELRQAIRGIEPGSEGGEPSGGGGGLAGLTRTEQIEYAANVVLQQAQPTGNGTEEVPTTAMALLRAAFGHDE